MTSPGPVKEGEESKEPVVVAKWMWGRDLSGTSDGRWSRILSGPSPRDTSSLPTRWFGHL